MTGMTTAKGYMVVETLIVLDPELLLPLFPGSHAARPPPLHELAECSTPDAQRRVYAYLHGEKPSSQEPL